MKTINRADNQKAVALFSQIGAHLMNDDRPSIALRRIADTPEFHDHPFSMLRKLDATQQSPIHHPEGNVWNHTLLVVDEAAKRKQQSCNPKVFMWAALLHDIGKPSTTKNHKGRITAYDHDKVGAELTQEFLSVVIEDQKFINKVAHLVKYHMQILYVVNDLPFKDINGMKRDCNVREVALLCLCDRLGRQGAHWETEEAQVKMFVSFCEHE